MHDKDLAVRMPLIEASRNGEGGIIGLCERAGIDPIFAEAEGVDAENSVQAVAILDRVGWPTESVVGNEAADAWTHLVAQRLSAEAVDYSLPHLHAAAALGEVSALTIAYVEDRADVLHGRSQCYGTQWAQSPDSGYEPHPLDDEVKVEERRDRLGLVSLAEYKLQIEEMFGTP